MPPPEFVSCLEGIFTVYYALNILWYIPSPST